MEVSSLLFVRFQDIMYCRIGNQGKQSRGCDCDGEDKTTAVEAQPLGVRMRNQREREGEEAVNGCNGIGEMTAWG